MLNVECPWCAGPLALDEERSEAECAACAIRVEIAPEPLPEPVALAA